MAMNNDTLTKDAIVKFLNSLAPEKQIAGPVRDGNVVEFRLGVPENFLFDDSVSYKSPKEFHFPQVEKIVSFEGGEATETLEPTPVAVFGARVCDLEANRVMREVFLNGRYRDTFFERRLDKNLVIGLGCAAPKPGCFCEALGFDKAFSDFCDIMIEPADGVFRVTRLGRRGAEAFASCDATEGIICDNSRRARTSKPSIALDTGRDEKEFFGMIDWEEAVMACQGCGLCTYICPTCHCFEFRDMDQGGVASRYRCWDSCMFPRFTLHASGHNPRASRPDRYRQRTLHKYLYVPRNTGLTSCTGCGRCLRSCPVGINIKSVATSLMEAAG
jgi:ferredoxin